MKALLRQETDLIAPVFYISKEIDQSRLKERAGATGKIWVFPDDPRNTVMDRMRMRRKIKRTSMGVSDDALVSGADVWALIPQRPPMVMIDRIFSVTGSDACTGLLVGDNNIFCGKRIF